MADAAKLQEMLDMEAVQNLKHLEPVSIDPSVAATHALKASGNDVQAALKWLEEHTADPKIGDPNATF
jgi:uncharacterized UBP type Zn finger protein